MEAKGNQNDAVTKKDCRTPAVAAARAMGRFRQTHRHNDPEKSVVRLILSKTESQKLEAQMKCTPSSSKEYRDANINANTFTFFILFMGHGFNSAYNVDHSKSATALIQCYVLPAY
jgi:hypothetical protein